MNWKDFLKKKGISEDDYKTKSVEEMAKLQSEYSDEVIKYLEDQNGKTVKELETLRGELAKATENSEETEKTLADAVKNVDDALEQIAQIKEKAEKGKGKSETVADQLKSRREDIRKLLNKQSNDGVVIKADTNRASITANTQSYNLPDIGQLAHRKLTAYDIFPKIRISESNNNGVVRYWDWDQATIVRAAATRAEGTAFPESTAKWVLGTIPIEKIGDTLPVTEEFMEDEEMFAAELNLFLDTNVRIVEDTQLVNGDGVSPNLNGIVNTVGAFTAVASGISDANIYDLLVKISESITSTGGSKYSPDFALMNIADINAMRLHKDANENYLIAPFANREGNIVDGIVVLECNAIAANTMVVGDRRFARIYEKTGVELSQGYVNAQFTSDMMTLKARKRLAFLIRGADLGGFAKVTSISADLATLATP